MQAIAALLGYGLIIYTTVFYAVVIRPAIKRHYRERRELRRMVNEIFFKQPLKQVK